MAENLPIYNRYEEKEATTRILITDPVESSFEDGLPGGKFEVHPQVGKLSTPDAVVAYIRGEGINYIVVRSETKLPSTQAIVSVADEIPLFVGYGRAGNGVDNIPVKDAVAHGLFVQNTPNATIETVGEHTLGLAFALLKRIGPSVIAAREGKWAKGKEKKDKTRELRGRKVLVIGAGRIGTDTAAKFEVLGCEVVSHDPFNQYEAFVFGRSARGAAGRFIDGRTSRRIQGDSSMGIYKDEDSLRRLLGEADIVTLHVDPEKLERPILGRVELAKLKPGAIVINTSRPKAVDHDALVAAIPDKGLSVALDVLPKEGHDFAKDPVAEAFLKLQAEGHNIIITPHLGGDSEEGQERIGAELADSVVGLFHEGRITNAVNAPDTMRSRNGLSPRVIIFNKDQPGATALVSSALANAGLNRHDVSFDTPPRFMKKTQMDMQGHDIDANGSSPQQVAATVQEALLRLFRDDLKARELLKKAYIL